MEKHSMLLTLQRFLLILSPDERRKGCWVLLLVLGMALLETAGVASVMPFLAILGNPELVESHPLFNRLFVQVNQYSPTTVEQFLMMLGIGSFSIIVVSAAYRAFTHYVMNRYIEMRRHCISLGLLKHYLNRPYEFFLNRHSSEISKTVLSEVDQLVGNVFRPLLFMIANLVVVVSILCLMVFAEPILAVCSIAIVGGLYFTLFMQLKTKFNSLGSQRSSANGHRFKVAVEAFGGIKELKVTGNESFYVQRFISPSLQYALSQASYASYAQIPKYVVEAIAFGGLIALVIILMITAEESQGSQLGEILPLVGLYAFGAYRIQPATQVIFAGLASLRFGASAVDEIFSDLKSKTDSPSRAFNAKSFELPKRKISFREISFQHAASSTQGLVDVSFDIAMGTKVGIVGATGSGKTTLIDVFTGLLTPTSGSIYFDDKLLAFDEIPRWQTHVGYVPQEVFLADSSIVENIALGVPENQIDWRSIYKSAELAQIHDFISSALEDGYQTSIGERGVRLSGGQRQRLGIARALYRDPSVLVFDEATSALDTLTENSVMRALDELAATKTLLIIAHRLSTIQNCDQILVLEKGRIVASGSFQELSEKLPSFFQGSSYARPKLIK